MFIRVTQMNESGKEIGPGLVNTETIEFVRTEENGVTALELASGRTRWVKESKEDLCKFVGSRGNA